MSNQEVLTKDNIALRFSYFLLYSIDQVDRFLASFDLDTALQYTNMNLMAVQVESRLTAITHIAIRQVISSINSEEINEKRSEICDFKTEQMVAEAQQLGLKLEGGVGHCGQAAVVLIGFLERAGIKAKMVLLNGHGLVSCEVKPGVQHLLDPDFAVILPFDLNSAIKKPNALRREYLKGLERMQVSSPEFMLNKINAIYKLPGARLANVVEYLGENHIRFERVAYQTRWTLPLGLLIISLIVSWGCYHASYSKSMSKKSVADQIKKSINPVS